MRKLITVFFVFVAFGFGTFFLSHHWTLTPPPLDNTVAEEDTEESVSLSSAIIKNNTKFEVMSSGIKTGVTNEEIDINSFVLPEEFDEVKENIYALAPQSVVFKLLDHDDAATIRNLMEKTDWHDKEQNYGYKSFVVSIDGEIYRFYYEAGILEHNNKVAFYNFADRTEYSETLMKYAIGSTEAFWKENENE